MDDDLVLMCYYLLRMRKQKKRKHWVNPIIAERSTLGTNQNLICELRSDEVKFSEYFKMSMATFDDLLDRIKVSIRRQNTKFRECIGPEERLAICLRYLVSGCSFKELHYAYRVGVSTISGIIKELVCIIWNALRDDYLMWPDNEESWENIGKSFERKADFPHCLGAVDAKHIRVLKPRNSGSIYYNHKNYFSVILLAIVDADYRFIHVNVGSNEKDCDSSLLTESDFWKVLNDGNVNIPQPKPVQANAQESLPYVFVGDEEFALSQYLLRPYGRTHLDAKKKVYNQRLIKARKFAEFAFDILINKWRILHRPLDVHPETAIDVVKACTALHNFVGIRDGISMEDIETATSVTEHSRQPRSNENASMRGGPNSVRSQFADYFVSEAGSVSWVDTSSIT